MAGAIPDSKSVHYNTPKWFLDLVIKATGPIDLDPCSNEWSIVPSRKKYLFSEGQDGLKMAWENNIFCNPPYGKDKVNKTSLKDWINKAANSYKDHVEPNFQASLLIPCMPDRTFWHNGIFTTATGIIFVKGRLNFGDKGNWDTDSAPMPVCLVYWGPSQTFNVLKFTFEVANKGFGVDLVRSR
jgi:hypothetical protein